MSSGGKPAGQAKAGVTQDAWKGVRTALHALVGDGSDDEEGQHSNGVVEGRHTNDGHLMSHEIATSFLLGTTWLTWALRIAVMGDMEPCRAQCKLRGNTAVSLVGTRP